MKQLHKMNVKQTKKLIVLLCRFDLSVNFAGILSAASTVWYDLLGMECGSPVNICGVRPGNDDVVLVRV